MGIRSSGQVNHTHYVRYADDAEVPEDDEAQTIGDIIESLRS